MANIKRIGVLTSGGDAPGMNATIRAVVRTAIFYDIEVFGIYKGYNGLIDNEFKKLKSKSVRDIVHRGGTFLKSSRSDRFRTPEGRQQAYENLKKNEIDALIVIGGDGSFMGAGIFSKEHDIPCIGLPGTIDNDMFGTDFTIGYDTALNTVVEAIDKIKDTAGSHERMFLVEVMGRDAGFIALTAGIATGAEAIFIPEVENQVDTLFDTLKEGKVDEKTSSIIIVAEGSKGGVHEIAKQVKQLYPNLDIRVNVLGHMQRGGSPTAFDRFLASRMGVAAVEALLDDQRSIMIGYVNHEIVHVPFNKTIKKQRNLDGGLMKVAKVLSI